MYIALAILAFAMWVVTQPRIKLPFSHHVKKDREVYRVTVLFRGVNFKKHDFVIYQGEEYQVKVLSKDIMLKNIKTGKKVHVRYKDMKDIKPSE